MRRWTVPDRTSHGEQHPVYDFLWEHLSLRPSLPERWHPGIGVGLTGAHAGEFLDQPGCALTLHGVSVKTTSLLPARREAIDWIARPLRTCAEPPPFFGCGGLHEWAMVYRAPAVHHPPTPVQFSPEELACIVESLRVRCSHYDAFRFFTPAARPLNRQQPAK